MPVNVTSNHCLHGSRQGAWAGAEALPTWK